MTKTRQNANHCARSNNGVWLDAAALADRNELKIVDANSKGSFFLQELPQTEEELADARDFAEGLVYGFANEV